VYCSALLFSPTRSLIKSQNIDKEAPKLFHSLSGIRQNWDPCFLTIETGETGLHIDKMVFSKDDQQLIAWSDVCVQVWSVSTGTFIRQFPKQDTHAQICVSRNGDKCAWLDPHSGRLMIGDTATGDTFEIDMRPDPIAVQSVPAFFHNIEFSDDAKLLRIYTEIDGNWTIVDVQQEMCLCTISSLEPGKRTGTYITFVGSSYLVISHLESEFHVWDVRSGVPMGKIEAKAPLRRLSGIPSDSTRVISMSDDTLQIWDLKKMICLKDIPIQHSDFLKFALSDYGKTLAIRGVTDTMLNIWDLDSLTHTLSLDITVNEVRLSPKGDILATTSIEDESRIALWDTNSGSQLYELDEVSRTSQRAFSFSHNGHYMAMMSSHFIKVHDVAHMSKPVMHKDHRGYCGARLASSNDGQWVALALPRQRLVLLNGTGVNYELLTGGEGDSRSSSRIQPAFSSDSNRIAAHCGAKMNLWSLVPSSPPSRTVFDCNFDALDASSCFSKDLNYFATATASELIIWDTKAGMVLSQRNLQDLPFDQASNQKSYHSLCFVKGGSCLAITGDSGSIIVLDSTTAGVLFSNRNLMPAISRILSNTSNGNEHLVGLYGSSLKIWVISDNFSLMEKCSLETAEDVLLSHGKQSLLWRSLETINLDDEHLQDLSRKLIFDLNPPYMLGQSCKSIIRHGKHLVWVPPEYRPPLHSGSVCEGSRMVMVSSTGMVLDIVFADEILD
jgi:hypothetical protein